MGGTCSVTVGTSTDHTAGKSESTGGSIGSSDSFSISEQLTNSNGGSRTISNAIERTSTSGTTIDRTTNNEIGINIGSSNSTNTNKTFEVSNSITFTNSTGITFSIEQTINGAGTSSIPCEVSIYKKVKRINEITSCYDRDDEYNYSSNTRSLVYIDIDVNAMVSFSKLINQQPDLDNKQEIPVKDAQVLGSCVTDSDIFQFKREYNLFVHANELINTSSSSDFYPVFTTSMELKNNGLIISDRNTNDKNFYQYGRRLLNEKGSLVYYVGPKKTYDTETGYISRDT
eukprot:jgi/Orpsp1_1/1175389/evm.model.c7180000053657.2